MKQVFTSEDRLMVYHLKNLLELHGIQCIVKNDNLSSVMGEVPVLVAWPELWVVDSDMEAWAKEIIKRSRKEIKDGPGWVCENCGEKHSAQFTECWNCQNIKAF